MSEKKKIEVTDTNVSVVPVPETAEAVYTMEEFAQNAQKLFGRKTNADLVIAAFQVGNRRKATLSEAKEIVRKFIDREVN